MRSFRHLIWIIPACLTIGWIATMMRDANIEEAKQQAFMMNACMKAGGEWVRNWTPNHSCLRPKDRQP